MTAVWYIGSSNVRSISSAAWTAAGITGSPAASVWNQANGWSIPAANFTAPQLTLLDLLGDFTIHGTDGPRLSSGTTFVTPSELLATRGYVDAAIAEVLTGENSGGEGENSGGAGVDATDVGYDIWLLAGQSNMVGQATNFDARTNPTSVRVCTFDATGIYANKIVVAADPLAHPVNTDHAGPAVMFGQWLATTLPNNRRVLLVPAAADGTAFATGVQRWKIGQPNDGNNLFENAMARLAAAVTAAGAHARIAGVLWHQGESDALAGGSAADAYQANLLELIDALRNRLGILDLPFLVGQMLYEFRTSSAQAIEVDAVHQAIGTLRAHTAFAASPGAGNSMGDALHFNLSGQTGLARSFFDAVLGATANASALATPSVPSTAPPFSGSGGNGGSGGSGGSGGVPQFLPNAVIEDDFNRPDSTSVGPSPVGGVTPVGADQGVISGNKLHMVGNSNAMGWMTPSNDYTGQIKCVVSLSGDQVLFRYAPGVGWYQWGPDGVLRKFPGTIVQNPIGVGQAIWGSGDVLKVKCSGDTFTFYKNGVQVGVVTDSSNPTGGFGVLVGGGGTDWDDLSISIP